MPGSLCNAAWALFLLLTLPAAAAFGQCSQWINESPGLNGAVYATTVWDPDGPGGPLAPRLIAGGDFSVAGGVPAVRIAQWNGLAWSPLANGINGPVRALAVYRGELIAGGDFSSSGTTILNGIGAWDGTAWRAFTQPPFPIGVDGGVKALLVRGDTLIVGGPFSSCGGVAASCIAQWQGGTPGAWSPIGNGFNFMVQCIADHEGTLIAGGAFNFSGGQPLGRIAMFSGGNWQPMGTGCDSNPNALLSHNGTLYVAGSFAIAGGLTVNRVARWTAAGGWAPMSTGLGGNVGGAWIVHDGSVLIGGQFTSAGGVTAGPVARWTGSAFQPFGSGIGTRVYSLTQFGSELIAGGALVAPGTGAPIGLARWRSAACAADANCDGAASPADVAAFVNTWAASLTAGTLAGDFDGNGAVQPADVAAFVATWFASVSTGTCP